MTTQASLTNSTGYKYFWLRIRRAKTLNIMTAVFALLGTPLLAAAYVIDAYSPGSYDNALTYLAVTGIMIAAASLVGTVALTIFSGINSYDWLTTRGLTDTRLALPLRRSHMFWADFLAGLLPTLLCNLCSGAIAIGILTVFGGGNMRGTGALALWSNLPLVFVTLLLVLIFLYSMVVFVTTLSGTTGGAVSYIVLLQILIPALLILGFQAVFMNVPEINITTTEYQFIAATSPGGLAVMSMAGISDTETALPIAQPGVLITVLLITAVFTLGAWRLSRRRTAESIGQADAFRYVHAAFSCALLGGIAATFALFAVYEAGGGVIIAMILTTAFIYFIMEVIAQKGIKRLGSTILRYVLTIAIAFGIGIIVPKFNAFGAGKAQPLLSAVESVSLNTYINDFHIIGDNYNYTTRNAGIDFTDTESIAAIYEAHKKANEENLISDYNYEYRGYVSAPRITLTYHLKNGATITRTAAFSGEAYDGIAPLAVTKEALDQRFALIDDIKNKEDFHWYNGRLFQLGTSDMPVSVSGDPDLLEELYQALKADIYDNANDNADKYSGGRGYIMGSLELDGAVSKKQGQDVVVTSQPSFTEDILSGYTRTLAVLEKTGRSFPDINKPLDNGAVWMTVYEENQQRYVNVPLEDNSDARELIAHLLPAKPGAVYDFSVNGYAVPPEYEELAQKLTDEAAVSADGQYPVIF